MDPTLFEADLLAKPEHLSMLADSLEAAPVWDGLPPWDRLVLLGMGSSAYAAGLAAARLQARGVDAVSVLASADLLPAVTEGTLVLAVSAGGGSRETRHAVAHYAGRAPVVVLTNTPDSELAASVDHVVEMRAGREAGGVACRSFQHTVALLLALEGHIVGAPGVADTVREAARASADLIDRRAEWVEEVTGLVAGPDGTAVVAPARRLSSAQQSALMLREGPRRPAIACETGDWSHVDVYLTKTTDYRMLLLAGSRWEDELLGWTAQRGSTVVAVGGEVPGAVMSLRYPGDEHDDVRLLTETLVAELVAARIWNRGMPG